MLNNYFIYAIETLKFYNYYKKLILHDFMVENV